MTLHISDEDGIRILKELAAERPEYAYTLVEVLDETTGLSSEACLYRHPDGTPGCIIGHLVDRLAPDVRLPEKATVFHLLRNGALETSDWLGRILNTAQSEQDYGNSWGDAVATAFRRHGETSDVSPV